ncbi:MAG: methyltransferase family protein [Fidelibacterota bacterium]
MDIREFFFRNRSYTSIPLALAILYFADRTGNQLFPGATLMILGELLRFNGVRYAGGATRTRKVGAKILCTSGPFGYVRNPLYLGNMMIYSGVVLLAGGTHVWIILLVAIAFFAVQYGLIISLEEASLYDLFGQDYEEYVRAVPRLIPRLTRWVGRHGTQPAPWLKTLRTEKRTLQMLVVFVCLLTARVYLLR